MSGISKNSERDRSLEFRGFLNDHLSKGKAQKSKSQAQDGNKSNTGEPDQNRGPPRKVAAVDANRKTNTVSAASFGDYSERYDHLKYSDASSSVSSSFLDQDKPPDAASEKELGNEYFKQRKFNEAIDCYSRSIALRPTSVAFANRAMAYLKVKRYEDAENDCTEALNFDDRYVKAYSRRATARRELGKLKSSLQDAEFAMRLEPNNQELKKQHMETKSLLEKEIVKKSSGASKASVPVVQIVGEQDMETIDTHVSSVSSNTQQKTTAGIKIGDVENNEKISSSSVPIKEISSVRLVNGSRGGALPSSNGESTPINGAVNNKQEMESSVQELASLAASRVKVSAAKNITAPKSAYQFEVSWRALSDDPSLQTQLLKTIQPETLPQIFKSALSTAMLIDIIKCTASFFKEDTELAISILDNLVRVPRFDMIVLSLSAMNHSVINKIWNEVFSSKDIKAEHLEAVNKLRPMYCYGKYQT
ncbi:TPR-like protein [Dioscorea alata]|uniref:TPR-like protein n=1 Tax=Dioscorea alata TaxID=55571 RepID=A0ACB7VVH4_DIOAL|nr:TPR-like protein [Dioscorea alata]